MKLVANTFKDYNYSTYKEELKWVDLTLHCRNEDEFMEAWEKIKDIDGVEWVGCPTIEDDGRYIDMVAIVEKKNGMTNKEVYEQIKEIRQEIEQALCIGKFRKNKRK